MKMRDYQKLEVCKKAHLMVLHIYQNILPTFPSHEKYDLQSQVKWTAYSVPLNIVEGAGRLTEKDFAHFLDNDLRSIQELKYTCFLSKDLEIYKITGEVKAILIGLIKRCDLNNNYKIVV